MDRLDRILTKIFGSRRERNIKRMQPMVDAINALEAETKKKTDAELREQTDVFKRRIQDGESLESLLPEAFAAVREAAIRTIGMRHFDVQLMGGIALFEGNIAEMATGEGKTLVATLPAYLIGLEGKGVHIVTVNDYLAKRDMEWMRPVYEFLGLSVEAIQNDQDPREKYLAYRADITYGTNNEFGFDYLRSNLTHSPEERPQRGLHYAIVDEVDSILIDEARTPLIISGPAEMSPETYYEVNRIIPHLKKEEDFTVDEKEKNILLTEEGMEKAQRLLGLDNMFAEENLGIVHHLDQALRAHHLYQLDVHYVIQDGQIVIVDEFTGRLMPGRRWSDGLHQAIEAKENVKIERENQTLATITFQNYFRMYDRLAGMTGTADTEAGEFLEIYKLEVVVIPTNKPNIRIDEKDQVYRTEAEKFDAIAAHIVDCHNHDQPVLVGTISIEKSEKLCELLKNRIYWKKKIRKWVKRIKEEVSESKLPESDREGLVSFLNRKEPFTVEEVEDWSARAEEAGEDRLDYHLRSLAEAVDIHQTIGSGMKVNVLNAKFHEREAEIVAQAGRPGSITIATNMAGRGTDIVLGGNAERLIEEELASLPKETPDSEKEKITQRIQAECEEGRKRVLEAGGLMIVGSERHESRRIDNQLRGRCGRQGDPGRSRFFLSLEDDLMRLFGGERIQRIADRFGMEEGEVIQARLVDKSIRKAQKKVEDRNFEIRKYVIKYDDVMNKQREVIYKLRNDLLEGGDGLLKEIVENAPTELQQSLLDGISEELRTQFVDELETASPDRPLRNLKLERLQELIEGADSELVLRLVKEAGADLLKQRAEGTDSPLLKKIFESGGAEFHAQEMDEIEPEDFKELLLKAEPDHLRKFLKGTHPEKAFEDMTWNVFSDLSEHYLNPRVAPEDWDLDQFANNLFNAFNFRTEITLPDSPNIEIAVEQVEREMWSQITNLYEERKADAPSEEDWRHLMRFIMLNTLDQKWKDHLLTMDHLKGSIGLRGYGGKDPQQEYSREGFELFEEMYASLERDVVSRMYRVQIRKEEAPVNRRERRMRLGSSEHRTGPITTRRRKAAKVGRNDPCPCGSGKKYKKCCMRKERAA